MLAILYGVNHSAFVSLGLINTMWQLYKVLKEIYIYVIWYRAVACCTWATNQLVDYSFMSTAICHGFRPNEISSSLESSVCQNNLGNFYPAQRAHPLAVKRLRPKTSMQFESYVACLFLFVCVLSVCVCVVSECIFCGAPVSLVRNGLMAHSNSRARKVGRPRHLS